MLFKNREQIINNGQTPELKQVRKDVLDILSSAIDAVNPYNAVKTRFENNNLKLDDKVFDLTDYENIYVVGFGKASVGMAQAVCDSAIIKSGIVITNDADNNVKNDNITTFAGGHPIPNNNSVIGAEKIVEMIKECNENDLLIVLISGGGSALLSMPRIGLEELQITTDLLLKSGADINEINTVRKHLSFVKGGQLASFAKCTVVSLIISDIIGDPIDFIASGPTYPDFTTFSDAKNIIRKYDLWDKLPVSARKIIEDGVNGVISDTPKKDSSVFDNVFNFIVANNKLACIAAEEKAEDLGYKTMLLTTSLDGEAKEVGKYLVGKAKNYHTYAKKSVFISGGETTVTIKGDGRGGRNQEMVLSSVEDINESDIVFVSFATDGIDGMSDAAGAIADPFTYKKSLEKGLDLKKFLDNNDSYEFFRKIDDFLITGATGTNVMDIQIIIKI